jgi:hypothetical protein
MRRAELDDPWTWTFAVFAAFNLANGAWMLADPAGWFVNLPAAVPDTGPFNSHFVRDVGSVFVMMGVLLLAGALRPRLRLPTLAATALFYVLHALVHVADTIAGRLPAAHWAIDFPGVYLPAILLVALIVVIARRTEAAA